MRLLLVPVAMLPACLLPETDCESWDPRSWYGETMVAATGALGAASFRVHSDDPGPWVRELSAWVTVTNPTDQDCVVAVYVHDAPADPEAVVSLDPESRIPVGLPGIGALVTEANLARRYGDAVDEQWTSASLLWLPGDVPRIDASVTVLTCGIPGIELAVEPLADFCDTTEAAPRYADAVRPESFSITRDF